MVSPLLVPVWIAGLAAPFRRPALRSLRFVALTYAILALLYLAGNGKAYYLASLYPVLLGLGALPVAGWTLHSGRRGGARTAVLAVTVAVSVAISALIALPLLPTTALQGSAVMAINPDQGETVGWPRFIDTVSAGWHSIPPVDRTHTAIVTANYGEASAIDLLGRGHRLPRAYSGHNGFSEWGRPGYGATQVLLIGYDGPAAATPYFNRCTTLSHVNDGVGLDNQEQGLPVMLCHPTSKWSALWPRLRHYD